MAQVMKLPIKMKIIMFSFMIIFMLLYMFIFGNKNAVIGMMIAMAMLMNLGNDLSFKPLTSFVKVLILFLILGVAAFLNNPLTIWACILTFLVVFGTTFTSYHLFGTDVYLPLLMLYLMMISIPVGAGELPVRLISLVFGAIFFVGFNVLVNRNKDYKISTQTVDSLIGELNKAIDVKLEGGEVSKENFKTANGLYLSIYNKFEYKYFPSPAHESVLDVIKSFQYIGVVLADYDLTKSELLYLKKIMSEIREVDVSDIFNGIEVETPQMNLILLNLEIIINEMSDRNLADIDGLPKRLPVKKLIRPLIKRFFTFRSVKFTFAFKMAFVLTLWQILTLVFNLPYSKWLYFVSVPLMLPYINDFAYTAKTRIIGTVMGVFVFTVIYIIIPYIPLSAHSVMLALMIICIFGMVVKLENKLILTVFTTVMSVTASLMHIPISLAAPLKILWVIVGVAVAMLINFGFLPYSVEKETKNNLKTCFELNNKSINLIRQRCVGANSSQKTTLLVITKVVGENIEITDENEELFHLQTKITDICNFILNYLDVSGLSEDLKSNLISIIDEDVDVADGLNLKDRIISCSMKYVMNLYKKENKIIGEIL